MRESMRWEMPGMAPEDPAAAPPAFLHAPTLDVGLVLSGQIVLEMEDGTAAELSTGQAFAQRSTPHRWRAPHPWTPSSRSS
ncbi:hypothetical protein ACTXG6_01005 [Pseudonocardia sp. Cha107L01]|uniref:hypothetical protein n=1 Tax=Pseudonocardia sp. Cha107L01 TaxID=3457576 RepID=UPI00403EB5F1